MKMRFLKILLIPVVVSTLIGCTSNQYSSSFDSSEISYQEDLAKYQLDDFYICKDHDEPTYFSGYSSLLPENYRKKATSINNYEELQALKDEWNRSCIQNDRQASYISKINAEAFNNVNLIYSPEYMLPNPSYSYVLDNVYFKNQTLYLHIIKKIDRTEGIAYPEVVMYSCFAFQIQKSVQYSDVRVILSSNN